jgi:hypothetical protein
MAPGVLAGWVFFWGMMAPFHRRSGTDQGVGPRAVDVNGDSKQDWSTNGDPATIGILQNGDGHFSPQ